GDAAADLRGHVADLWLLRVSRHRQGRLHGAAVGDYAVHPSDPAHAHRHGQGLEDGGDGTSGAPYRILGGGPGNASRFSRGTGLSADDTATGAEYRRPSAAAGEDGEAVEDLIFAVHGFDQYREGTTISRGTGARR
nr:hypothetical protein [Tanacetum cinerariifolium]